MTSRTATAGPQARHPEPAHWRGERPLLTSFWLRFVLPVALLSLALGTVAAWMALRGEALQLAAIGLLVGWPLLIGLVVWGGVGAWRSAATSLAQGGSTLPARAAQAGVVVLSLAALAAAGVHFIPRVADDLTLARGVDPLGQAQFAVSPDGRRAQLQGPLGLGDGDRVERALAAAPQVRLLELASPGGRFAEAQHIAHAVRARGLQTRLVGPCSNACTVVFLAGSGRQVMPGGQLGFQRLAPGTWNPLLARYLNRELAATYRGAGVPQSFMTKILSTPPTRLWVPDIEEVEAAGLAGVPGRPLDVPLPAAGATDAAEFAQALRSNRVWQAVERRHPGSIADAAQRMLAARQAGATDDAAQVAGQRVVEALLPALQFQAGPAVREQFVGILGEQLTAAAAAGPDACRGLLAGDAALRRSLPEAVAAREAAWLVDAAAEPVRDTPPRRMSHLELEVVRRTLGERGPLLLDELTRPASAGGWTRPCALATELVTEIAKLPPAERKLVVRMMFER